MIKEELIIKVGKYMLSFHSILEQYRQISFSEHDKGDRFERLMQAYLRTDPKYAIRLKMVWLWKEFPGKEDLGGSDTGIDLVALTNEGDYWAIQCKFYQENSVIDKPAVDSFLATSSRQFKDDSGKTVGFSQRLWISTTNQWGNNATEAIQNQNPPVTRINLRDLIEAPVDWEKLNSGIVGKLAQVCDRDLKPHQKEALEKTYEYFNTHSRGKLIMACGTGKTFNSLRIAEKQTDGKGLVLFLVPSIALLGQALREWTAFAQKPIYAICICSDPEVSRKKIKNGDDSNSTSIVDLALPASTNVKDIVRQFQQIALRQKNLSKKTTLANSTNISNSVDANLNLGMIVVFSTYQSIDVIAEAQKELAKEMPDFSEFDLTICDEAHRTTGVSLAGEDASVFTKVHNDAFLRTKKRLYMTATPRLYSDDVKSKAAQMEAILCSMDDEKIYGQEIYRIGFGEAVQKDLLTDYKVLILTISDTEVPLAIQNMIVNQENEINTDDASKLIGCINALSKKILGDAGVLKESDPEPMRKAVAFCQTIAISQKITKNFNDITTSYLDSLPKEKLEEMVTISSKHLDGTMSAPKRDELLSWLKSTGKGNECRILTNVRCLSEGIDVPALDAVMFLSARNSQIDVVQSVGRVMRKAPNKKYGYIIIPIVVPANVEPAQALDNNERYKVVWTVLNALRAHDDRFNATINKIELNRNRPCQILVAKAGYSFDKIGNCYIADDKASYEISQNISQQLTLEFEQLKNTLFARMVEKVGSRTYWEQWAKSVAEIAERQIERIHRLIQDSGKHQETFRTFLQSLQNNINPSISQQEAVEMLSQHIITKPIFEALFENYSFVQSNPISISMQGMLNLLEEQAIEKDTATLQKFYESVKVRASGIDNAEGKQRVIIELYEKFFKTAFPKMVEKLGIVYTPVEIVDFIIHSVSDVLQKEFERNLSDENIHILDPFTGTGTFITRLLQSGLIEKKSSKDSSTTLLVDKKKLARKYQREIHANEIVLLAYYIAAVNIENAFHDAMGTNEYQAFEGICLTDTFQLGETDEGEKLFSDMFPQNSARVRSQKKAPLRIIIGNPPYSVGQKSANDNAQNQKYPKLDKRIADTYVAMADATNKNSLYDSYIKAFRWSTDRLEAEHGGIICFVSNGAWLDGNATSGFRKCLEKEFSSIYVFNLRGNARTQGELRRKECGNIFGSGSRTPIAITLLVKNPAIEKEKATIYYHDIGDYLSREEKLEIIRKIASVSNPTMLWNILTPNEHGDWISQRNDIFETFIPLGDKDNKENKETFFVPYYSNGVKTNRDAWCYNFSKKTLEINIRKSLDFFNQQSREYSIKKQEHPTLKVEEFIDLDSTKISWDRQQKKDIEKERQYIFEISSIIQGFYRPYHRQWVYFNRQLNNCVYQLPKLFPQPYETKNLVICASGIGVTKDFSVLITNILPDIQLQFNGQCFPLYYYEERQNTYNDLFAGDTNETSEYIRRDAISDFILDRARKQYGQNVTKEDIFYYVYGFLHSPEYRQTFANDLKKMLPRLPLVDTTTDFWAFSKAGRKLADLHINYETAPACQEVQVTGIESGFYTVEKMRFPTKDQKDTILYNSKITLTNIPAKAYEYIINGKSAIEWIMERYQITIHKESGIRNDPNDWAIETGNPGYILDLLLSIITVSIQTIDIVNSLPKLDFK